MKTQLLDACPSGADGILSFLHFGDLHVTSAHEQNYHDFLAMVLDANAHLSGAGGVNFAVLPGDNADDGTEPQFRLVAKALELLQIPVHVLPGDHDVESGNLQDFYQCLSVPPLPRSFVLGDYQCLFLNSVDTGGMKGFQFGQQQIQWLREELARADAVGKATLLFMHTYPSELGESAAEVTALIRQHRVLFIDTGHTHYNEISNDGRTIYAATRSTGQIEEGLVGYSLAAIDGNVISWKFKELRAPWPLVLITSPSDRDFITDRKVREHVVRGSVEIRAKIWGGTASAVVTCRLDDGPVIPMRKEHTNLWICKWDSTQQSDGFHRIVVSLAIGGSQLSEDSITVLVNQEGHYQQPERSLVDLQNSIGAHVSKGILGTQLGPNKNGRKWPKARQSNNSEMLNDVSDDNWNNLLRAVREVPQTAEELQRKMDALQLQRDQSRNGSD